MIGSSLFTNALSGINRAQEIASRASANIASGESEDYIQDIVDLKQAKILEQVNIASLKIALDSQKSVLDILA